MTTPTKCPHCGAEYAKCCQRAEKLMDRVLELESQKTGYIYDFTSLRGDLWTESERPPGINMIVKKVKDLRTRLETAEAERDARTSLLKRAHHWLESHRVAFDSSEATDKLIADITSTTEGEPTRDAENKE